MRNAIDDGVGESLGFADQVAATLAQRKRLLGARAGQNFKKL